MRIIVISVSTVWFLLAGLQGQAPEETYKADLLSYPGPWYFQVGKQGVVLVRDDELDAMAADPDQPLNLTTGRAPRNESLRQICERAKSRGQRTLSIAFDHFFAQYRPGQETPRRLMPDMDEYISKIAAIGRFAAQYGLGLELSLLSPLEVGKAYAARTGESGVWMHYREGVRDPVTGAFSVELWQQRRWSNNKGPVDLEDAGARVFAFRERPVAGTPYRVVSPSEIVEIHSGVETERMDNLVSRNGDYRARRIRVHGAGAPQGSTGLDRVLVVQHYRTPEMDYFSPNAGPFLTALIDRYAKAGVVLNGLYSDEMHIQQDWYYTTHHDHGELALRYVSAGLAKAFAERFGSEYGDFAKYLVYFARGQEDFANDLSAKRGVMHVFGASPEEIQRTALFRARYYRLLQDGVVDLFVAAKRYAEKVMGHRLAARYHATWAQSPTIDYWETGTLNRHAAKYEYTSNFVWSNTVQQAAAACDDYFKWGDFLVGGGNDHTEGGYLDRNYHALALASSTGILNEVPYSYAAHWGMPGEIRRRRDAVVNAYGASASAPFAAVQNSQHRDVDVLALYPMSIVAVDERFGTWMSQYGYANMVTAAKFIERASVSGNRMTMAGRTFTTLYVPFEPFPPRRLLEMLAQFVEGGGRVVWSGPPPLLTMEGDPAHAEWQNLFGVSYRPAPEAGLAVPGAMVRFEGVLATVQPQGILTDFLVDRIYPVEPRAESSVIARVKKWTVGAHRRTAQGGSATYLGFRPRDDQSQSLGYDVRTLFDILHALGAYPPTGRVPGANDNTEYLSRTGDFLVCRFPNGAVGIAPHLKLLEEDWPGGFARDEAADKAWLEKNPLPPATLRLTDYRVNGHTVTYEGSYAMSFRTGARGALEAFAGSDASGVTVDGKKYVFSAKPLAQIAFAPVAAERRVQGGAAMQILAAGDGAVRVPAVDIPAGAQLFAEGDAPGSRGTAVAARVRDGSIEFELNPRISGRWIYVVAGK